MSPPDPSRADPSTSGPTAATVRPDRSGGDRDRERPLPEPVAIALVAGTSAAVLVLEILAGRIMAPYVGVSLETYTAIIGTILAGIALGAAVGGWAADRTDPRQLLAALLVVGGALAIASIPIVRALGGGSGPGAGGAPAVVLAAFGFIPSTSVLSAVPPVVVKLQLRKLDSTGATVGRLSGWSTGGALVGTFVTGFILVAYAAVTTLVVGTGVALVAGGVAFWIADRRIRRDVAGGSLSVLVLAVGGLAAIDTPCDVQTGYYCVAIEVDPDVPTGRTLILDDLRHSYVDLADPTHLEFWYVRRIVDAIETFAPPGPIRTVSLGGGGMTIPAWLQATRPGSEQVVLEIDPELVDIVADEFGFAEGPGVDIVTGDGRLALRDLETDSVDVLIGDAFGSRSVPWHLATKEFVDEIARVLRPGGLYVVNVIDGGPEDFLRAEAATTATALPYVHVVRSQGVLDGLIANSVMIASDEPLDVAAWDERRTSVGDTGGLVDDMVAYTDGALVLTDDFAPVDQLISGLR